MARPAISVARPAGHPTGQGDPLHPFTLLVAEPDTELARHLAVKLRGYRVDVHVCGDGAEALLLAGMLNPHALLVSAELPVLSVDTVLRVLRRRRSIPVILGVGTHDPEETVNARTQEPPRALPAPTGSLTCCLFFAP
jgi:CheY-like chemotaxis protein